MRPARQRTGEPRPDRAKAQDIARGSDLNLRFFDVERDISQEDWEFIMKAFAYWRDEGKWTSVAHQAMFIDILSPGRKAELNIDEAAWQSMLVELERDRGDWWEFATSAMAMVVIAPDRRAELNIDEAVWQGILERLENRRGSNWLYFAEVAKVATILFPDRRAELNIDEAAWQPMLKKLEDYRNIDWGNFIYLAKDLFMLAPDRKEELGLDEDTWQSILRYLDQTRISGDTRLGERASRIAILAADDIRITTEGGLELIYHAQAEIDKLLPPRAIV